MAGASGRRSSRPGAAGRLPRGVSRGTPSSRPGSNGAAVRTFGQPQRVTGPALTDLRNRSDPRLWRSSPYLATFDLLAVPLRVQGQVLGTLSVSRQTAGRSYTRMTSGSFRSWRMRRRMIERTRLYEAERQAHEQTEAARRRAAFWPRPAASSAPRSTTRPA